MPTPEQWEKVRKAAHAGAEAIMQLDLTTGEAMAAGALVFGAMVTAGFQQHGVPKPMDLAHAIIANALDMVVLIDKTFGHKEGR